VISRFSLSQADPFLSKQPFEERESGSDRTGCTPFGQPTSDSSPQRPDGASPHTHRGAIARREGPCLAATAGTTGTSAVDNWREDPGTSLALHPINVPLPGPERAVDKSKSPRATHSSWLSTRCRETGLPSAAPASNPAPTGSTARKTHADENEFHHTDDIPAATAAPLHSIEPIIASCFLPDHRKKDNSDPKTEKSKKT
jgi:hypothetical protein